MVQGIGHVEVARCIHSDARRSVELRARGRPAIAGITGRAVAGGAHQHLVGGHFPDPVIARVEARAGADGTLGEIQDARGVHGHPGGSGEPDGKRELSVRGPDAV